MTPLAHALTLLAMTVATVAIEVVPLDMALDSFDDQYRGCSPAMTTALPALNHSEFQKNPVLAEKWSEAVVLWQRQGSRVSPLSSPNQAIAIMAFMMGTYSPFNVAVHDAGCSPQVYRDKFHYKSLHFLLTQALGILREDQNAQCLDVFREMCGVLFEGKQGDTVRFGQFMITSQSKSNGGGCPDETVFQVHTCHGARIQPFSEHPEFNWVLIPPFETFEVTEVTRKGDKVQIQLRSTGTHSKYNCEWLKGGSDTRATFHLRGLLLATTALAVATRFL